jgi:uncharacterized 2Fe-2S/4Fe-4S cluster protein (DUF4445 family)
MNLSTPDSPSLQIDFEPVGRRAEVQPGVTLLEAAQQAGVGLVSLCGGEGWCGSCRVRIASGDVSPPTSAEHSVFSGAELVEDYRLACQAIPLGDVKIDIPSESLSTPQRLQIEGHEIPVKFDPLVQPVDLQLTPPTLHDLRSDTVRIRDALAEQGYDAVRFGLPLLGDLAGRLRTLDWSTRLALRDGEVIAALPAGGRLLGLAVDIGTTKLAAYLVDLTTGATLAMTGAMNPQIAYGEDVVSRIAYTREHLDGRRVLQARLVETLNEMVGELCTQAAAKRDSLVEAVVVGNTAMHHLFAGLPVEQLGLSPYVPAVSEAFALRAGEIELVLAPGAYVYLLPNIAGYVGADHVAMVLATDIWQSDRTVIAVDIGTNTEITLATNGRLLSCSCASGPAFEGAHIRHGMRAAAGAIERVQITGDEVHLFTIDNRPPVGICGSGILDVVAEMRSIGALNERGALQADHPRVRPGQPLAEFLLVPASATGHGRDITMNRKDINEIQLAKGAIRTGIEILLATAGIPAGQVESFVIAGAFGTYIHVGSAVQIGMFPNLPIQRFHQVGNAAGIGAKQVLISAERRQAAIEIVERIEYIELTTHPDFQELFLQALYL